MTRPAGRKLYTPAQAREALTREGVRLFTRATADHTITHQKAARIIGVPWTTWTHWESQGGTPVGAWGPTKKGVGRCKIYTRGDLDVFAEKLRREHQAYPGTADFLRSCDR